VGARVGRKSKLTPELQETILGYIREGAFLDRACQLSGIGARTYHDWIERGEQDAAEGKDTEFSQFSHAATQARAQVQQVCISIILNDAPKNPESAKWFLERSFWTEWGKRSISLSSKLESPEEEDDKAPAPNAIKAVLLSLVEAHPEIREELAQRLEALSP
jgi:hypothetical protein